MNERAREILVRHALAGTRQVVGVLHDGHGGYCATWLFVKELCEARPGPWWSCLGVRLTYADLLAELLREFDIAPAEFDAIVDANDAGADFLTIARKFGASDAPRPAQAQRAAVKATLRHMEGQ